ncbi:APC family permease [Companilactobacillus kimchii]|uniref:APA family basic amino acid polyamine antiporter n=2 Tax=Companilactobacillus kimchii TaxID=2801452 RepID=A0ABR5NQJ9_9LACO|nr:amino acid permease [Companilactobacillus kimchii]KAE9562895.1 amino acid permease [Companilactobacillus kimchii]KRK49929.1 APA family basic amino acid polyamine antiporter [Companilactobacillus kimchii DSM 13961 = JCM 10707]OWF33100.1 Y+L amino acid transporter [Companilactobacillus kimchii]GEO46815.1 amino acid permease [Companilactobacillus paralimentarius]
MGDQDVKLKKTIGFFPAFATVTGSVIGTGVFFKASAVTNYTGSTSLTMLVWVLGGFITICAGLTGAELAAAYPETGGLTKYIEHSYGGFWGFMAGWAQAIIYFPANVAAISIAFGTQFTHLFTLSNSWIVPVAILSALSVTSLNWISAKVGGRVTSISLVAKLIPLALIVLFGFMHKGPVELSLFPVVAGPHRNLITAMGNGLLATMFAYDGWIHVGNISGEMKNPRKDLPKAISLGIAVIMLVYVLVNAVFMYVLPINQIAGNLNAASDASTMIFGNMGSKLVTIGILISVYGGLNGYTMTSMRIPYIMGKEHKLPFGDTFAKLNKAGIPWAAGAIQLVIACLMMLTGEFDAITNMLIFVIWVFYVMAFIAVIKLRHTQPELERPYKVPLYPIIPIIAILGGVFILVCTLLTEFVTTIIGISVTAIGVPIYFYLKNKWNFDGQKVDKKSKSMTKLEVEPE